MKKFPSNIVIALNLRFNWGHFIHPSALCKGVKYAFSTENMLSVQVDKQNRIAILEPQGALSQEDFESASNIIDPYIDQHVRLDGLIIHTQSLPGWDQPLEDPACHRW